MIFGAATRHWVGNQERVRRVSECMEERMSVIESCIEGDKVREREDDRGSTSEGKLEKEEQVMGKERRRKKRETGRKRKV